MRGLPALLLLLLLPAAALPALAEGPQVMFTEVQRPGGLALDYLFKERDRLQPRRLAFLLPAETVHVGAGSYHIAGHYDPEAVTARVKKAVEAAVLAYGEVPGPHHLITFAAIWAGIAVYSIDGWLSYRAQAEAGPSNEAV